MATVNVQYVTMFSAGKHGRQPRQGGSSGFTLIPGAPSEILPLVLGSGGTFTTTPMPGVQVFDGLDYTYAFTSVSDGTSAGQAATGPINFPVGNSDITVLYVFIGAGVGPPGSDYGATIDAFDASTGSLVDNFFVTQVNPDDASHDNQTEANQEGYVDTTANTAIIVAYAPTIGPAGDTTPMNAPTSAQFAQWLVVPAPTPQNILLNGPNLTVPAKNSIYALAIYQNPAAKPKESLKEIRDFKEWIQDHPKGLIHDKIQAGEKIPILEVGGKTPFDGGKFTDGLNPGQGGYGSVGQGAFSVQLSNLTQKIANLEGQLATALKGSAFIKPTDRPVVGKPPAKKTR
jgi:hypothetical protein